MRPSPVRSGIEPFLTLLDSLKWSYWAFWRPLLWPGLVLTSLFEWVTRLSLKKIFKTSAEVSSQNLGETKNGPSIDPWRIGSCQEKIHYDNYQVVSTLRFCAIVSVLFLLLLMLAVGLTLGVFSRFYCFALNREVCLNFSWNEPNG